MSARTVELTPYELWMVRSNLRRIAAGEQSASETIGLLRRNGYLRISGAVRAATAEQSGGAQ